MKTIQKAFEKPELEIECGGGVWQENFYCNNPLLPPEYNELKILHLKRTVPKWNKLYVRMPIIHNHN